MQRNLVTAALVLGGIWAAWFGLQMSALAFARSHEATGRVVSVGEAEGEWRSTGTGRKRTGHTGPPRDRATVLIEGVSEAVAVARERPSNLQQLKAGDRVQVRYDEGGFWFWHRVWIRELEPVP